LDFFDMLLAFLGFVVVLLLTYYATRFMAGHFGNITGQGKMKLREKLPLGKDKCIAIVEVDGRMMLIGISEQNINLLTDLPDLNANDFKTETNVDFGKVLMEKLKEKANIIKPRKGDEGK